MLYTCENCRQTFKSEEECELHEDWCYILNHGDPHGPKDLCGIPESNTTKVSISVDEDKVVVKKQKFKTAEEPKSWNIADCKPYTPFDHNDCFQIDYWEDEHTKKEAMLKLAETIRESVADEIESIKGRQTVLDSLCDRADELEEMASHDI